MAEGAGMGKPSEAVSQPPVAAVAATSRPVFVSYASADAAIAQKVCAALETAGILCWIAPRDVVPGTLYADGIVGALDESKVLVLILSKDAVASAHVGRELERATSKRHPIVALRLDTAPLNRAFEYFLNQSQWIEMGGRGVDTAIARLVEAVGRHLAAGAATTEHAPQAPPAPNIGGRSAIPRSVWGIAAAVVVLALVAGYFVVDKGWRSMSATAKHETASVISDKSIAVLPFVDMSEKQDQEYFSDGLSEELIDMLTKVPDLKVPARTSSFYFKDKRTTIGDIAKALGVSHVLEGSVRKSGRKLRITAQLIRVEGGYHVWSQTYDRDTGDIFQIQDDISSAVVSALKVSLGAQGPPHNNVTPNKDAYDLYLLAQSRYEGANSHEAYQEIIGDLQEAIRLDPSFGRAWAFLSGTLSTMAGYRFIDPTKGFDDARSAALKAIELSPSVADGHRALAKILYLHDWEWQQANQEMQQALTIAPDDPRNLTAAGIIANILGSAKLAVQYSTRAVAKDPLSSTRWEQLGQNQMGAGHLVEAVVAFRRSQELNPSYLNAHWNLGTALLLTGNATDALAEFERESDDDNRVIGRALAYFALGRSVDADIALRKLEMLAGPGDAYGVAQIHAYRGERDQAFVWLTRAYEQREPDCAMVKLDPLFKSLHTDERYKAFLKKMNLPYD